MRDVLMKVEHLAIKAHGCQRRQFEDAPYIVHLVRVMNTCREYTCSKHVLAAAILHDVLEDTPVTAGQLLDSLRKIMALPSAILTLNLVQELTDVYTKKNYPQWNRRVRKEKEANRLSQCSADAQTIKYADILDNVATMASASHDFTHTYCREALQLLKKMDKGNPDLRQKTWLSVNQHVRDLNFS